MPELSVQYVKSLCKQGLSSDSRFCPIPGRRQAVVSFDAGCKKAQKALASVAAKKAHITQVHLNKVTCPDCRGDPSSCDCIKNRLAAGVSNTPRSLTTLVSEQQLEKHSSKYLAFRIAPAPFLHQCTSSVCCSFQCRL